MGFFEGLFGTGIEVKKDIIKITGRFTGVDVAINKLKDIKTSRVTKHMFITFTNNRIEFDTFYSLEVVTLFEILLQDKKYGLNLKSIKKATELIKENTYLKDINMSHSKFLDYSVLSRLFNWKPLPHQQKYFEFYDVNVLKYSLNGNVLHADPGTGKTFMGLAIAEMVHADKVLIVCPPQAVDKVWRHAFSGEDVYRHKQDVWVAKDNKPYKDEKYLIVHYNYIQGNTPKPVLENYVGGNVAVILDESHNMNELKASQTQNFIKICERLKSKHVIFASGTPIKALGSEMIPMLRVLDKHFTDKVAKKFLKVFGSKGKVATKLLQNRLGILSHKIPKAVIDLPPPTYETVMVKVPDPDRYTLEVVKEKMQSYITGAIAEYRKDYSKYKDEFMGLMNDYVKPNLSQEHLTKYNRYIQLVEYINETDVSGGITLISDEITECNSIERNIISPLIPLKFTKRYKHIKSIVKYITLKVRGEALGRILTKERMDCFSAIAENIDYIELIARTIKKTLIFSDYVKPCQTAVNTLDKLGIQNLSVFGDTTQDLSRAVGAFKNNDNIDVLVTTYKSLSTAVPLVMCDTVLLINTPVRSYVLDQAVSRVHRLGQDSDVLIINFDLDTEGKPNLNSRNLDILSWSQEQVMDITGTGGIYMTDEVGVEDNHLDIDEYIPAHNNKSILTNW